ncbi:hypothetical protein Barb6XT_02400 [Bacteroidales bacterium Barb6XT]|nr:hypothetical protein Barb6XT_02400 [Bacteroidales bacterium Barb6XT]
MNVTLLLNLPVKKMTAKSIMALKHFSVMTITKLFFKNHTKKLLVSSNRYRF